MRRGALKPHHQALGIELKITLEEVHELGIALPAAVAAGGGEPQRQHFGTDGSGRSGRLRVGAGDAGELAHLGLERLPEACHLGHAAEVHEVHRLRAVAQQALDGGHQLLRIELRRGGGREDEGALRGVERTVGDPEGVAGEDARVRRIDDRVVVQRVTGRVDELERARTELHALPVGNLVHALRRHGTSSP